MWLAMAMNVTLVLIRTYETGRESGEQRTKRHRGKFLARALIRKYWQDRSKNFSKMEKTIKRWQQFHLLFDISTFYNLIITVMLSPMNRILWSG